VHESGKIIGDVFVLGAYSCGLFEALHRLEDFAFFSLLESTVVQRNGERIPVRVIGWGKFDGLF